MLVKSTFLRQRYILLQEFFFVISFIYQSNVKNNTPLNLPLKGKLIISHLFAYFHHFHYNFINNMYKKERIYYEIIQKKFLK